MFVATSATWRSSELQPGRDLSRWLSPIAIDELFEVTMPHDPRQRERINAAGQQGCRSGPRIVEREPLDGAVCTHAPE